MPLCGIRCAVDQKNRRHQIIHQQTHDPGNLNIAETNLTIRKAPPRRRSMMIYKRQPDLKHLPKQRLSKTTSDPMALGWS